MYETNTGNSSMGAGPPADPGQSATGAVLKQSADEAKAEVKDLAQQAQAQARDLAYQAQSHAKQLVESKKSVVAESLASVARALDSTASSLQGEDPLGLSTYARSAASSIESFSSSIKDKDLHAIRGDAERFARAQPALFIGGCVALGFALSRFFKSTSKQQSTANDDDVQSFADGSSISNEPGFSYQQSTRASPASESWDEPMGTSGLPDEFGVTSDASGAESTSSLTNAGEVSSNYTSPWSNEVKR